MRTQKAGVPVYAQCSRESARKFIKLYAGIRPVPHWFHQTLTFGNPKPDIYLAHARFNMLLDSLEKAHPDVACFFVREQEKDSGFHFHVIFLFFGTQPLAPKAMRIKFGAEVFVKWNKINGGGLFRNANQMTLRAKEDICIWYLTGWVKIVPKTKRSVHWNGLRNKRLIHANSTPAPKSEVKRLLKICFDNRNQPPTLANIHTPHYYDSPDLQKLKAFVKSKGDMEWEDTKRNITGRKGKVTDDDMIDFFNRREQAKARPTKPKPKIPDSFPISDNRIRDPDETL